MIAAAGELRVPFTSGHPDRHRRDARWSASIRCWRCATCIRSTATFRKSSSRTSAPSRTRAWRTAAEPDLEDLQWTVAVARLIFGGATSIQVPPNLSRGDYPHLIDAGINDWGGVSPVTPDHVNPEAPWPQIAALARGDGRRPASSGRAAGRLSELMPLDSHRWQHTDVAPRVLRAIDADGFARCSHLDCRRRSQAAALTMRSARTRRSPASTRSCRGPCAETALSEDDIVALFAARGGAVQRRLRGGGRIARRDERRHGALCRQPQHQLHQRLLLSLPVLRLLQGQGAASAARPALRSRP